MGKNPDSAAPPKGGVPRICDLVNIHPMPKQPAGSTLEAIANGIKKPLTELWAWGEQLGKWDAKWNNGSEEEQWARAISELLTGTAYFGPNIAAFNSNDRTPFYESFCSSNPAIAIVNPCETLTTYILLSRGYKLEDVGATGLESGDNSSLPVFKANGGRWNFSDDRRYFKKAIEAGDLKPGSCYGWHKLEGGEKALGSHAVGVLRVDEETKTAQLLDTGAAQSRLRPGETPYSTHTWGLSTIRGNYDNAASSSVDPKIAKADYKGLGTPAANHSLKLGLERLKKTRPLGLVRLFVATDPLSGAPPTQKEPITSSDPKKTTMTVPKQLVFMSRVCRMWGEASDANYSIMRCQWSLRSLPPWKAAESGPELPAFAWWVFFSPMGELAKQLLDWRTDRGLQLDSLKTTADKGSLVSPIYLIIRSDKTGKTDWAYVSRALEPLKIGSIPSWMSTMLSEAGFDTVFNRHKVAVPFELNDGLALPATP
jgi:hypothetical protein